ncbi:uncharacterized protein LOC142350305 [Convolutriloba macropyga]|uniref:uncharacterized protein LOC142350305 n=1 Tax=Convolutriloba macropyga TaxID=536237 RepID=UPI003F527B70
MNRTPPSLNISSPYMGLAGHADDDDVSPIVRVADNIVAATGLVFIIPAVTAFKRKLFFECWVIACIVPINLLFDFCDLSPDLCLVETTKVWMKAFTYLIILDLAYLYANISIYYRAPLVLTEVSLLTFLYQALVFERGVGSVAFIDGAVGIIALITAFESWIHKILTNKLEGKPEKEKIKKQDEQKQDTNNQSKNDLSEDEQPYTDPGTWMILLAFCGIVYVFLFIFPANQEERGTLALLIHAFLHTVWHGLLSATATLLVNILEEVPFVVD